jgi:hypothetical protein
VFSEVAGERVALGDAVGRVAGVVGQARGVLVDTDRALVSVDPALVALRGVAPRVAVLLGRVVPFGRDLVPALSQIAGLLGPAERALRRFVPAERVARPALTSLTSALSGILPVLSGLRPYAPDVTAGFFNGVGGAGFGDYDANGHYLRARVALQGGGASLSGLLGVLGQATLKLPGLSGARSGLLSPCPGGGAPSAPDASNPWTSPDTLTGAGTLCNPGDDLR